MSIWCLNNHLNSELAQTKEELLHSCFGIHINDLNIFRFHFSFYFVNESNTFYSNEAENNNPL